ncbi:MAG TPA: acetyl-CoA carboxylase biotin carboxyl carrier protein subunit [Actinobacteria bacterium]|nr:acetyl-CoA carboxylase biotin carboxyl carrier protein subunit [Actinomycetota bacterium]
MDVDAETTAKIWEVRVSAGEAVEEGDVLLVLDLDGTPRPVHAPTAARVAEVHVAAGDRVAAGDPLVTFG